MKASPSSSSFTIKGAHELLQSFNVADDPASLAFLTDLLVSGVVPPDEVNFLRQTGALSGGRQESPTTKRQTKKRKDKAGKKADNKTSISPFFDDASSHSSQDEPASYGIEDVPCVSAPTTSTTVIVTKTVYYASLMSDSEGNAKTPGPHVKREGSAHAEDQGTGEILQETGSPQTTPATARVVPIVSTGKLASVESAQPPSSPTSSEASTPSSPMSAVYASPAAATPVARKRATTSHFFTPPSARRKKTSGNDSDGDAGDADKLIKTPSKSTPRPKRPPRGTVSRLPFAPLTADRFGLLQEQLAHDPFWLLVALVFLVRVSGRVSVPVFWRVHAAYPTAEALAAADPADLMASMHHLGMASVRCAVIQRYAVRWLKQPPQAGVTTVVKNYPLPAEGDVFSTTTTTTTTIASDSAWEIGHLTQGAYAVDSWRIFCRDTLLLGRHPSEDVDKVTTRQPEWMRVLPRDKELRAYLRWMWMRDGWDWDPRTGERTVLREELRQAVNEGRVGYDGDGQLQILDEAIGPV